MSAFRSLFDSDAKSDRIAEQFLEAANRVEAKAEKIIERQGNGKAVEIVKKGP